MNRFERQTLLPDFGEAGQAALRQARVLVVGAGGLGCPALLYLAAAGVGHLGIVDGDRVHMSNLHRQVLFGADDVGQLKAEVASRFLSRQFPDVQVTAYTEFLQPTNAWAIMDSYDMVLDGSDNFPTRYLVNDVCKLQGKPLVMGAIYQYEGQVAVFHHGNSSPQYRDLHPNPEAGQGVPNCSEIGVLGVVPGIIGMLQAAEAIKLLAGVGQVLSGKVLYYNVKSATSYTLELTPQAEFYPGQPTSRQQLESLHYGQVCGVDAPSLSWEEARARFTVDTVWVDIREPHEIPKWNAVGVMGYPSSSQEPLPNEMLEANQVFLVCQSGKRSAQMAQKLKSLFPEKQIYSIEGGVLHSSSLIHHTHGA
jgi:sulfur-carrier protein adenylyltransferase/sulfurtransferase